MRYSVVFDVALKLLVINSLSSSPAINKLLRLLPAISVLTCRTTPVATLTTRGEAIYRLRIAISAYPSCIRCPRYRGVPVRILQCRLVWKKLEWFGYPTVKRIEDIFIRFDRSHERDSQTDTLTPHDGIGRAYA